MKIRYGFVTNSSSSHYIVKNSNDLSFGRLVPDSDNNICVEGGEYGWSGDSRDTPYDKLSYIITMINTKCRDYEELEDNKFFRLVRDVVYEYTGGCELKAIPNRDDKYNKYGYIDHQSTDILDEYFALDSLEFKERIKEFIFCNNYSIIISNDNT